MIQLGTIVLILVGSWFAQTQVQAQTPLPSPSTEAERSGWLRTGRYAEVEALCAEFPRKFPGKVKCLRFGITPEGRPMLALVASADGVLSPDAARSKKRPVVLAQGSIHAGECDGKDAGFYVLRELLQGRSLPGALKKVTFVFVPVFNIDGHERFGPNHRPNQRGPEEMGWRVTGQSLNLNRDYVKADAPEMQAMLRLLGEWDPILYADLHVTDGADFQHDIAVVVQPRLAGPSHLVEAASKMSADLMSMLAQQKHPSLPFYPDFVVQDDPTSGFNASVSPPRYSESYWSRRNRIGALVETHSWKDYPTRVRTTIDALSDLIELTAKDGQKWLQAAADADQSGLSLAGLDTALTYENTDRVREVEFLGYAYKREVSEISGALMTSYDPTRPQTLKLPLKDEVKPKLSVKAPLHGYYVMPPLAEVVEAKLKLHKIEYQRLKKPSTPEGLETFRVASPEFAAKSYEGHQGAVLKGAWHSEVRSVPMGSVFVPIRQARSLLLMQLLEPMAPDSLASWGFFNAHFERREYMEDYVAEQVARDMMAKNPAIRAEFEARLRADAAFAKDPAQRLEFFYRKHPSWDEKYGLYPVYRN